MSNAEAQQMPPAGDDNNDDNENPDENLDHDRVPMLRAQGLRLGLEAERRKTQGSHVSPFWVYNESTRGAFTNSTRDRNFTGKPSFY